MTAYLNTDDELHQIIAIMTVHGLSALVLFGVINFFCWVQFNKYKSWKQMFQNHFVVVTLLVAICILLNETLTIIVMCQVYELGFASVPTRANDPVFVLVPIGFMQTFAMAGHVYLLYMQTKPVVEAFPKVVRMIRMVIISFSFFGVITCFTMVMLYFKPNRSTGFRGSTFETIWDTILVFSDMGYGSSLCSMDFISTISFVKYVMQTNQALGAQEYVSHQKTTYVIAKIGAVICMTSMSGSVFFIAAVVQKDFLIINYLWIFQFWTMDVVAILWLVMKIKIDYLSKAKGQKLQIKREVQSLEENLSGEKKRTTQSDENAVIGI
jgi:hypothetical protein